MNSSLPNNACITKRSHLEVLSSALGGSDNDGRVEGSCLPGSFDDNRDLMAAGGGKGRSRDRPFHFRARAWIAEVAI